MVAIDEILAAAIRTAWLQVAGPDSWSHYHVEVESARRVRATLEREGVTITEALQMPGAHHQKKEESRKDAGDLTEDVVDKIYGHQKARRLEQKTTGGLHF